MFWTHILSLPTSLRSGSQKNRAFLCCWRLKGDKRGDRAHTEVKVSALIAIAVQCHQVQTDTDKQEKNEYNNFPELESRLFQFDCGSLVVYSASVRAQWWRPTWYGTDFHSTTEILNNDITKRAILHTCRRAIITYRNHTLKCITLINISQKPHLICIK